MRLVSHRIADQVYEKLTGDKGVFSTRIAYVTKAGQRYNLWVADADGENAQAALTSPEPIISPAWSPNGTQLAYVSFEARKPVIYAHDVATGRRRLLANFRGSNSAPSWSPDGRSLALKTPDQVRGAASVLGHDIGQMRAGFNDREYLVQPSYREAQGIAILEALAAGRVVVASNVGGIPEMITDGENGILVPSHDPSALASAILSLFTHPDRAAQLAAAGHEMVHAEFCIDYMLRDIEAIYATAVGGGVASIPDRYGKIGERS